MAVINQINPTLIDLVTRQTPEGSVDRAIVEILNQDNEILEDMVWKNGNQTDGHLTTIRTGLPTGTFRKLYEFVQPEKSTTVQVRDKTGRLETFAEVDEALLELSDDKAAFLLSENYPFIEGMGQTMASTIFTGNESNTPAKFTGLMPRFNSKSANNGRNIIDGGSTHNTENNSIWLVGWGERSVHGIVPKGAVSGLQQKDLGIESKENSGGILRVHRTQYNWNCGVCVRDWRFIVRIANIDPTKIVADAATGPNLPDLMDQAVDLLPTTSGVKVGWYMNRKMRSGVRRQCKKMTQYTMTEERLASGKLLYTYHGIPMRVVDALDINEAKIS